MGDGFRPPPPCIARGPPYPTQMRVVSSLLAALVLLVACAGCGGGTKDPSLDLTFFLQPVSSPALPLDGQPYTVSWTMFNADEVSETAVNIPWRVSRDGIDNFASGTIGSLHSRDRVDLSFTDSQAGGTTHVYVITIDPDNTIPELTKHNNSRVVTVVVAGII